MFQVSWLWPSPKLEWDMYGLKGIVIWRGKGYISQGESQGEGCGEGIE